MPLTVRPLDLLIQIGGARARVVIPRGSSAQRRDNNNPEAGTRPASSNQLRAPDSSSAAPQHRGSMHGNDGRPDERARQGFALKKVAQVSPRLPVAGGLGQREGPLGHQELDTLLHRLGVTTEGRDLIKRARREAPVREVQSRGSNVVTHYVSRRMSRVISTESHTVEHCATLLYEFDSTVLEYYAQPAHLDLVLINPITGKQARLQHFPDFLILTPVGVFFDEWKPESKLCEKAKKHPHRYRKEIQGWRSPMLEPYFENLGIGYRLRSSAELPTLRVKNLALLADYLAPDCPEMPPKALDELLKAFEQQAAIPLLDLLGEGSAPGAKYTDDDIYRAIATRQLTVDFDQEDISETDCVTVYRDEAALRLLRMQEEVTPSPMAGQRLDSSIMIGTKLGYGGETYEVILTSASSVRLRGGNGQTEFRLEELEALILQGQISVLSPSRSEESKSRDFEALPEKAMQQIVQRLDWLEASKEDTSMVPYSERTLRRWRKALKEGGETIVERHMALAPKNHYKGNRNRKLPDRIYELIRWVEKAKYNTPTAPNKRAAYKVFVGACNQETGLKPCSEKTFLRLLGTSVRKREGKRRAYQEAPIVWYLEANTNIHGIRPFEFIHIDSTPLELLGVAPNPESPESREILGTIWLCLATDAASRWPVAYYVSYESPSYRTTMMLLRDMVRRYGRIGETLIVDRGAENRSAQLFRLCRICGCHLRQRPPGEPRVGSVLERLFGTIHTQFIHQLEGNTKIRKHHRCTTKSVRPENSATWTLLALHRAFEEFLEKIYGTENHPAHGGPPKEFFLRRMAETGTRRHRMIKFDRRFLIETCPSPEGDPTRIVDPRRGIKVSHIWYHCLELNSSHMDGKSVEVRIDPWDPGIAFALIDDKWYECSSKYRSLLGRWTWLQLRYALPEITRRLGIKKKDLTQERIAAYLRLLDPRHFDPRLASQQEEARLVYEPLGLAAITMDRPDRNVSPDMEITAVEHSRQSSSATGTIPDCQSKASEEPAPAPTTRSKPRRYDVDYDML